MNFVTIDIVFAVLLLIFTVRCALRGFIGELMSMASLVLGLLAALYFYRTGGAFVRERFMPDTQTIPEIIAFAALFLIVFIVIKIIERMLKQIVDGIKLGGVDRFLGIFFGFIEGVVVISLVLFLLQIQPFFDAKPIINGSFFADILLPLITGKEKPAADVVLLLMQNGKTCGV